MRQVVHLCADINKKGWNEQVSDIQGAPHFHDSYKPLIWTLFRDPYQALFSSD